MAIASGGGELLLLDFRAGREQLLRGDRDQSLDAIGFSSDGQLLMAVGQDGELLPLEPLALSSGWLDVAAWQPSGLLLAVASADAVVLWSQHDTGSRGWRPEPLLWHGSRVTALAFAPGQPLLTTTSGDGKLARLDSPDALRQVLEGDGQGFNDLARRQAPPGGG